MHDIFSGASSYDAKNILNTLIYTEERFDMDEMNKRRSSFPYNEVDRNNIPPLINEDYFKANKLMKMSAAENLSLMSNLGLMIGDLVPRDNECWQLFIKLREIISIIMKPRITLSDAYILETLVQEHNLLYAKLYGDIPPRIHNMVHFSRLLLEFGPIINYWCMRYESKNKLMKELIKIVSNCKNLLVSMVTRAQLKSCYLYYNGLNLKSTNTSTKNNLDIYARINFPSVKNFEDIESFSFIEVGGHRFEIGSIIVSEMDPENDELNFGKIFKIYRLENKIYFLIYELQQVSYDSHYQAYEVRVSEEPNILINYDSIPIKINCTSKVIKGVQYVGTRFEL